MTKLNPRKIVLYMYSIPYHMYIQVHLPKKLLHSCTKATNKSVSDERATENIVRSHTRLASVDTLAPHDPSTDHLNVRIVSHYNWTACCNSMHVHIDQVLYRRLKDYNYTESLECGFYKARLAVGF